MDVSVIMAVYNGAWCIERALDSALHQTVPPREIIVCDDGSTDGTPDLVEDVFGSQVTLLRLPHRNAPTARRIGLDRATGDWLAFMDADDVWIPRKLERQLDYLARHPDVRHLSSDGVLVSAEGVVRASWLSDYFVPVRELYGDLLPSLVERCYILMSSVLVERGAYHEVGGIEAEMVYSHDYDLWMRILGRYPGAVMAEPLIQYFSSPGALSQNFEGRDRDNIELMRRLERGMYRRDPVLQRRGAERAAMLEYKLGVRYLRTGRGAEGRALLRHAAHAGPARQRLLAILGSFVPDWAVGGLRGSRWLRAAAKPEAGTGLLEAPPERGPEGA